MMSIEEYRAIQETPEEEWNFTYNNKRVSVEALEHIELKKRGKGPEKPLYEECTNKIGPFYDPNGRHVHIFKEDSLIQNFVSEQVPGCKYVQYRDYKPGTYCSICHCSSQKFQFSYFGRIKKTTKTTKINKTTKTTKTTKTIPLLSLDEHVEKRVEERFYPKRSYDSEWKRIISRAIYTESNKKIVYPISKYKSLLLWPWQLTPYQKFKLENSNYKDSCIFLRSKLEEFRDNYAAIV